METLIKMFLDYANNFLTIKSFAEWYGIDEDDAKTIINMGMKYNDRYLYRNIKK